MKKESFINSYASSIILILSIIIGSVLGIVLKEKAVVLKPLGDIFLNLLFTIVVPLVFFSISSSMAQMTDMHRLGKIVYSMLFVFVATSIVAGVFMIIGIKIYPPVIGPQILPNTQVKMDEINIVTQIVNTIAVSDFVEIFSKKNMIPLIVFSFILGLATSAIKEKGQEFRNFLISGNEVMTKAIGYVMVYAPIGLGAYFAYLIGAMGPSLFGSYFRSVALYYPIAFIYFGLIISFYAWLGGGNLGLRVFWSNILPPAFTAWATGSSLATLPVNLEAAKRIGLPEDVRQIVVNMGASIHRDGSCLAAVAKIALLFGIFGIPLEGWETYLKIIGIAFLCSSVVSGIPQGGILGEFLIITMFGFPLSAMPIITMLGTLVDPPATMINVVGDNVCGMLVARMTNGKKWLQMKVKET